MKRPDRRNPTIQFAMHADLHARLTAARDAKQARIGAVRYVALNEILKDLLDVYEETERLLQEAARS